MKKKTWTKKEIVKIPFAPKYPPSKEQEGIFTAIRGHKQNLHIEASPGSGKTTTIIWAMNENPERDAAVLAFSKEIVNELEPKCPADSECRTAHSFGYRALSAKVGKLYLEQGQGSKVKAILKDVNRTFDPDNFDGKEKGAAFARMFNMMKLVNMLRVNLTDENNVGEVIKIVNRYNIEIEDMGLLELLPKIFQKIIESPNYIDYTDMLWLPIRMNLKLPKFNMLYIDERQDLNSLMIEYIFRMVGERIMTCGDSFQSIFAFGGADIKSTERLIAKFGGVELPLNVCYRCGTKIVEFAQKVYNKIQPWEGSPEGVVDEREDIDYDMPDGSMILCRRNANLIKPCFKFLRDGRKAIIKGRDIGAGIISLIKQMKADSTLDLVDKINDYRGKKIELLQRKEEINASQIDATNDQCDCICEIAQSCSSIEDMENKINIIFSDDRQGVTLSSVHRSKGLEADQVTIIDFNRIRLSNERMKPEDHVQEKNLDFVARTRAKRVLHIIK